MKKFAEDLAKDYDLTSSEEYFQYIVDSLVNGQREQVKKLFRQMKREDQDTFLIDFLGGSGIEISCRNICIKEI